MISYNPPRNNCPLCGGLCVPHFRIKHPEYPFSTSLCRTCGFVFMNPSFSEDTLTSFYTDTYYSGDSSYVYIDERKLEKASGYVWNARLKSIKRYVKNGRFLDVGCSFGGFLDCAKNKGFTPYGIEVSEYSGGYAKKRFGETIHIGTLENCPFEKSTFSIITMIEVIEHLQNPVSALRKCYSMLKPGGMMLIQTADMNGWQAVNAGQDYHYFLPGHLSYFTAESLEKVLLDSGFSHCKIFRPVDFGLLPKLMKSRKGFTKLSDYKKWFNIASYHLRGKFSRKGRPMTSSMVIYAFKD
jgi:2-polyprenyl-3-methyl-5-hydroxy-6-metoxy-1,4-benzoquinol methylase